MKSWILLAALLLTMGCREKAVSEKAPIQVKVALAKVEDINLFNSYVGNIQPYVQVEVKAQVEGVLTGYYFTEGQEVKKGDLIFTIDSRPYQAQLAQANAALAQSIASLKYAQDVANRNSTLVSQDYISKQQYDLYTTEVLTHEAEIKQNEAQIETAEININYCNIRAPMDAITGELQINVGNLIANNGATPLVTLNQITPTYAYFSIPQKDLSQIMPLHRKEPLQIEVFLNGDYQKPFKGTLDLIDNQVNNQTGAILLRGLLPNEDKMLWPGEFVDVHLITGSKKNAILVPTQAIGLGQKGKYLYIVKEDSTVELRNIQAGQQLGELTFIEQGVNAGDRVVVEGQINLKSGVKVSINQQDQK